MISREMTPHSSVRKQAEPDRTRTVRLALSPPKFVIQSQKVLSKQAEKIADKANIHEQFINKVTYCLGVLSFGTFCYLLGSRPQDIPRLYCLFYILVAPLRWIYYRIKKWHYYLLDFCYYANAIFVTMLLFFPDNEKLFMACFSFSEGPLAWALIVWRCSLVFSSIDKIISVVIHLLPGTVFFIIRWWDPSTFPRHSAKEIGPWPAWPVVTSVPALWTWLFFVPLLAYCIWQALYFLVVEGLRRQRILEDPEVMTSYRELKRKAERAKNLWWRLSGLLGAENRVIMYAIIQAAFTVAALAFTVPLFKSYRLHVGFEIFKISTTVWNGGSFVFEVMPRQVAKKNKSGPIEVVDEIHRQESSADSKKKSVLVPPVASTGSSDVASLANRSVRLRQKEQDVCALCSRPRFQNLAASTNRPDNVTSTRKYEDGAASLTMRSSTNGEIRMFSERRQVPCNTRIDALIRNLNWTGQVACVG